MRVELSIKRLAIDFDGLAHGVWSKNLFFQFILARELKRRKIDFEITELQRT